MPRHFLRCKDYGHTGAVGRGQCPHASSSHDGTTCRETVHEATAPNSFAYRSPSSPSRQSRAREQAAVNGGSPSEGCGTHAIDLHRRSQARHVNHRAHAHHQILVESLHDCALEAIKARAEARGRERPEMKPGISTWSTCPASRKYGRGRSYRGCGIAILGSASSLVQNP